MTNVDGKIQVNVLMRIYLDYARSKVYNINGNTANITDLKMEIDINKHTVDSILVISCFGLVNGIMWYTYDRPTIRLGDLMLNRHIIFNVDLKIKCTFITNE